VIDRTLKKRGQLHLIYNQPLRLIEKDRGGASGPTKRVKPNTQNALPTQLPSNPKVPPDPQVSRMEGVSYGNVPSSSTSARVGGSTQTPPPPKRPSDTSSSAKKRQKLSGYPGCPICGGPHHLVKDCPVVAEGSPRYCHWLVTYGVFTYHIMSSIRAAISRLEAQSGQTATVAALRDALRRLEKRAPGLET
jgi:chromodomain-helicase-DNA-binding protein 4